MSKIQSHANCEHVNSKAARAKCRRSRAKFADAFSAALSEGVTEVQAPVFEPVRVTRENWRDFKETPVRIATQIDDDTQSEIATGVYLTGWGGRWINYTNDEGKTKRADVTCVRVTTLGEA